MQFTQQQALLNTLYNKGIGGAAEACQGHQNDCRNEEALPAQGELCSIVRGTLQVLHLHCQGRGLDGTIQWPADVKKTLILQALQYM
jgi:hypothetical protein